jgi:hypothetical protein
MKLAKRSRMKKAMVALARKVAIIMHRILAGGMSFRNVAAVKWSLRMMTQIVMARYAPASSSPAQVRAAGRLRGSDVATRPSQAGRINPALSSLP